MEERTLFLRPPLWLPVIVAFVAGGMYVAGKYVEVRGYNPPIVAISGEGKEYAVPDIAEVFFGVETGRQKTAQQAMSVLKDHMNAIVSALKKAGIADKDIQTQNLSLSPAYDYQDGKRIDRGFEANQSLRIKVRDTEKIGEVLQAAVSNGANQVGGVNFTIDDPESLRAAAREKAIKDAKGKATILASQLGKHLGRLRDFQEGGGPYPVPMVRMMKDEAYGMGGGAELPVPTGEQEILVNVTLMYELR